MMHNQSHVSAKNVQKVKLNFKVKTTTAADAPMGLSKGTNASREVPKRTKKLILNRNVTFKSTNNNDSSMNDPSLEQRSSLDKNLLLLKLSKGL
jgi:hypothetical protein